VSAAEPQKVRSCFAFVCVCFFHPFLWHSTHIQGELLDAFLNFHKCDALELVKQATTAKKNRGN